jgi:hypothetical protein
MTEENNRDNDMECPICLDILGSSHAVMCNNNHKICGTCLVNLFSAR